VFSLVNRLAAAAAEPATGACGHTPVLYDDAGASVASDALAGDRRDRSPATSPSRRQDTGLQIGEPPLVVAVCVASSR
jgi:hypothetical protein